MREREKEGRRENIEKQNSILSIHPPIPILRQTHIFILDVTVRCDTSKSFLATMSKPRGPSSVQH